jgi:hypothetical protein
MRRHLHVTRARVLHVLLKHEVLSITFKAENVREYGAELLGPVFG